MGILGFSSLFSSEMRFVRPLGSVSILGVRFGTTGSNFTLTEIFFFLSLPLLLF